MKAIELITGASQDGDCMDLENMQVFVPSRSRFDRSITLEALAPAKWKYVALVVPTEQRAQYEPLARKHGVRLIPCPAKGIAGTREFIGNGCKHHKFIMLDDDLRFYRRLTTGVQLHKFGPHDMVNMLMTVSRMLDIYKHVSISARGGNNQLVYPSVECKRPLRVLAYRKKEFMQCVHRRVAIMEDFDVTLQLIAMGYPNLVITQYAQDQPMTQAPGGCSDYRTHKLHEENVRKMAALHPGICKIRDKENKTGGEFGSRVELTIYWDKARKAVLEDLF